MLILDKNPKMAADALPTELIDNIGKSFSIAWQVACGKGKPIDLVENETPFLIYTDLCTCDANINWYREFISYIKPFCTNEIGVNIDDISSDNILPSIYSVYEEQFYTGELKLHSPFIDTAYDDIIQQDYQKYVGAKNNPIVVSRLILADMKPEFEDFRNGVPNWLKDYSMLTKDNSNEILSAYDSESRLHIKIIRDGKRFRYYTSLISDNWKEIENVPEDIDKIISYLSSSH